MKEAISRFAEKYLSVLKEDQDSRSLRSFRLVPRALRSVFAGGNGDMRLFHGGNTGSIPVGRANDSNDLALVRRYR
jgi:hypothetical protein